MNTRKSRFKPKWLGEILMILCLAFGLGQSAGAAEYGLGDIPLDKETYQQYLKVWPDEVAEAVPTRYDARDDGIVTSAKNQGSCGSCWAFASVGAFESHLLKAFSFGPTDLSEQQQVSCNLDMSGCCGGGMEALQWWEIGRPITEACLPYAESGTSCPTQRTVSCSSSFGCEELPYRVTNWHTVSTSSPTQVKTSLYNDGPSYFRFDVYDDFSDFWHNANPGDVYVNSLSSTFEDGHAVLIIGWDDNEGVYLCKNSWGDTEGPNGDGTFWIAYNGHAHDLEFGMANFDLTKRIHSAEYFIDTDPGEGNGIELTAKDGTFDSPVEEVEFSLDTSDLTIGIHILFIRMQNEEGLWGTPRKMIFEVTGEKYITGAEYFIGTDPGPGNGTPIPPTDGSFDEPKESVIADIDTSDLLPGSHTVYVRMKDSEDHWGTPRGYKFEVREPPYIMAGEFFIDDDPGTGNATPLATSDGSFDSPIEDMEATFETGDLSLGPHTLFVRTMDSYLRWGDAVGISFEVTPAVPIPDIKANGSDAPLFVTPSENVSVTISLNPGDMAGEYADWWVGAFTPFGNYWVNPSRKWVPSDSPISVGQYPLFDLSATSLLSIQPPEGIYTFFFVLDDAPDGTFGVTWYDYVNVICQPEGYPVQTEEIPDFDAVFHEKMRKLLGQQKTHIKENRKNLSKGRVIIAVALPFSFSGSTSLGAGKHGCTTISGCSNV